MQNSLHVQGKVHMAVERVGAFSGVALAVVNLDGVHKMVALPDPVAPTIGGNPDIIHTLTQAWYS
jgi:hypothetical protein